MNRVIVVVMSALAATRLMRAWLHEQVGEPFRQPLEEWLDDPVPYIDGTDQLDIAFMDTPSFRIKSWLFDLITCPHCLGFWTTLALILAWPIRPVRRLTEALAGAMLLSWFVDTYPAFDPEQDPEPARVEVTTVA